MGKLYLKQEIPRIRGEVTFFDVYETEVYRSRSRGNSILMPLKYELLDVNDQAVVGIFRTSAVLLAEYKVVDLIAGVDICKVRKKSCSSLSGVEITTTQGRYSIDGSIWYQKFEIFDEEGRKVIHMQKKKLEWGNTYEVTINTELIDRHFAAGIVLAVDCTYHTGN